MSNPAAPTRAQAEAELVSRCGRRMALVGLAITTDGSNAALDGPLREGLFAVEIPPAGWTVADADLAGLDAASIPFFLDVAELRILETVLANWDEPDQKQNADAQDWGKLAADMESQIAAKRAWLTQRYQFGVNRLDVETLSYRFVERDTRGDF